MNDGSVLKEPSSDGSVRDALAAGLTRIWSGRNPASIALYPVSLIYRALIAARRAAYGIGVLGSYRAAVPVIVVGNITVGGSGKTPFTIWLVGWLKERGFEPGIVLRGYRGRSRDWPLVVGTSTSPEQAGDEAVLLARRTSVPVIAGPDRRANCRMLLERFGCDVIVSDDGLQHLALHRDYEIVLHDPAEGQGNGWCLPAGPLREPAARLRDFDQVIEYGSVDRGVVARVEAAYKLAEPTDRRRLEDFSGDRILALTAIARPQRFFQVLERHGLRIDRRAFTDHHLFRNSDIDERGYDAVLVTEKDAVKLHDYPFENIWVVVLELQVAPAVTDRLERILLPILRTP